MPCLPGRSKKSQMRSQHFAKHEGMNNGNLYKIACFFSATFTRENYQ
jgi:hypothetical protein